MGRRLRVAAVRRRVAPAAAAAVAPRRRRVVPPSEPPTRAPMRDSNVRSRSFSLSRAALLARTSFRFWSRLAAGVPPPPLCERRVVVRRDERVALRRRRVGASAIQYPSMCRRNVAIPTSDAPANIRPVALGNANRSHRQIVNLRSPRIGEITAGRVCASVKQCACAAPHVRL
jgi:hypothetical protein